MESPSIVELAKKFNDSINKLNDLIQNLDLLNNTLKNLDKSVGTMSEFKQVLIDNNIVKNLEEIIASTDTQYKEIVLNIKEVSNYINAFSEIKDTLADEVKKTVSDFATVKNTITEFRKNIYPSIEDIKNYLGQLNEHNYTEISKKILDELNTLHKTILNENQNLSSHIKNIEEDYLKSINEIKTMYESYSHQIEDTNRKLSQQYNNIENKLASVIKSYNSISKTIDLISENNEKSLAYFYELCNSWAESNIKKLALKKNNGSFWKSKNVDN